MKAFIGYDIREDIAYQVCEYSLQAHTPDIKIEALDLRELQDSGLYNRPRDPLSTTEFTYTRFLVPYLQEYRGWALFCDCDFLWLSDVDALWKQADDRYAVMVVKHDYRPPATIKMDNCRQTVYPRKNWSSMILWNCAHASNRALTPDLINTQSGQYLHRFQWLQDHEIGSIDKTWTWLVGWYQEPEDGDPRALHYTEGGPWFKRYRRCEYHKIWKQYLKDCLNTKLKD